MKRIGTMFGIITAATVARAEAQATVTMSVGIATPNVSGYVVVGDRYAYRPGVVVIDARRPRVHRPRVVVIKRGHGHHKHRHRHHHRHHRCDDD
jgi:hypothetical protein